MTAVDVSNRLGEYMLKGWVLTDNVCPNDGCPVPLMRSPNSRIPTTIFCASCDGHTQPPAPASAAPVSIPPTAWDSSSSTSNTSTTRRSRSSSPPTDVSSALSSPTFAPPVDTEEALRRRQQSDVASAEIGRRLLKGWAMLADECPNVRCYGVPLVRPPLSGGVGKDPRKECVACGTVYVDERDAHGWERLVVANSPAISPSPTTQGGSNRDRSGLSMASDVLPTLHSATNLWVKDGPVGNAMSSVSSHSRQINQPPPRSGTQGGSKTFPTVPKANPVLEATVSSLEIALQILSQRLVAISNNAATVDPMSLGQTVDTIGKILLTLTQVEQLRRENRDSLSS